MRSLRHRANDAESPCSTLRPELFREQLYAKLERRRADNPELLHFEGSETTE